LPRGPQRRVHGPLVTSGERGEPARQHAELQIVADRELALHALVVTANDVVGCLELAGSGGRGQSVPREHAAQRDDKEQRHRRGHAGLTLVVAQGPVRLRKPDLPSAADALAPVPPPGTDDGHAAVVPIAVEILSGAPRHSCSCHPRVRRLGAARLVAEPALADDRSGTGKGIALPRGAEASALENTAQLE